MGMIKLPEQSIQFFNENCGTIFETGALAEGMWNIQINNWIKNYTGAKYSSVTSSNGSGILALLVLLKHFGGYKKFFIQSNTMCGVKTMGISAGLEYHGAVECSLETLMPTFEVVKDFIFKLDAPEDTVFLVTHIGGWVNPDIEKIAKLCVEKGVALIEDCAHSLGATLDSKHTGLFGLGGVYSLYATKAVPAGEGGIVVTNDEEISQLLEKFLIYDRFDQKLNVGVNFRMSEISALLAYSVLKQTENILINKIKISQHYIAACEAVGLEYFQPVTQSMRSNLYKFIVMDKSGNENSLKFTPIKTRTSSVYDYALGKDPNNITKRHICLPIWYRLEDEIIEKVCKEIQQCH